MDYDNNIVFRDCQTHFLNIYSKRKEILLIFFRHAVELPIKINRYLTTFEILAYIERETAKNDNYTGNWTS